MSNAPRPCQFWRQPDHLEEAKFTFIAPDGTLTYICEEHSVEYATKFPDSIVRAFIAREQT